MKTVLFISFIFLSLISDGQVQEVVNQYSISSVAQI